MNKKRSSFCSGAFTLVELLVVIGIIALLISMLFPALSKARRAADTVKCASNMRSIMQGVQLYVNAYNGAFPGSPWTSAAHIRHSGAHSRYYVAGSKLVGDNNVSGVNSIFDWMSPVAKQMGIEFDEGASSAARKSRYLQLLQMDTFKCPSNDFLATAYGDNWGTLPTMSYLTSLDFMLVNNLYNNTVAAGDNNSVGYYVTRGEWNVPAGYSPRISKIGSASEKVFLSEGSRFIDGALVWTYNSLAVSGQQMGGNYADQRAYVALGYNRSRLFQGRHGNQSAAAYRNDGRSLLLAYRHGTRSPDDSTESYRMNLAFFDGHVETVGALTSLNPTYWSPRGTELNMTTAQVYPIVISKYMGGTAVPRYICP